MKPRTSILPRLIAIALVAVSIAVAIGCGNPAAGDPADTPAPRANADLASLSVGGAALVPAFDPAVTEYRAAVPFGTTEAALAFKAADDAATVGAPASVTGLAVGIPAVAVLVVTAEDGATKKTYRVEILVTEPSRDSSLAALSIAGATLVPAFDPAVLSYRAYAPEGVASAAVSAEASSPSASLAYAPSASAALPIGVTRLSLTVTAQDGSASEYVVVVDRAGDYPANYDQRMKYVPAGSFRRSAAPGDVTTVEAFRMSLCEVMREKFSEFGEMADPSNAARSTGTTDPVQRASWYQALVYCNRLSALEGLEPVYSVKGSDDPDDWGAAPIAADADWDAVAIDWGASGFRLPTEAEWLWAAMGADRAAPGQTNETGYLLPFSGSTGSNVLGDAAWVGSNSGDTTHPVTEKAPNALGLYDMTGNVWEWCWDRYAALPAGPLDGYSGPATGQYRMLRGGSWADGAPECALALREAYDAPHGGTDMYGFRVVRR